MDAHIQIKANEKKRWHDEKMKLKKQRYRHKLIKS